MVGNPPLWYLATHSEAVAARAYWRGAAGAMGAAANLDLVEEYLTIAVTL